MHRTVLQATCLLAAAPAIAQTAASVQNARNASNLNVLQSYYPKRALAAREQGSVGFRVKIDASGQPTECQVTKSSGFPLLDKETCDLITLRAVFKPAEGLSGSQVSTHDGLVNWTPPSSMNIATAATPNPLATADLPDKKICKKVTRTGSMVASERVCMTAKNWQQWADESRGEWDSAKQRGSFANGN
jgi:TonB family protein